MNTEREAVQKNLVNFDSRIRYKYETFVEPDFVTMVTQRPVIITEPFTPKLTNTGSPEFEKVRDRLLVHMINGSDIRLDIFVQRIRFEPPENRERSANVLSSVFFIARVLIFYIFFYFVNIFLCSRIISRFINLSW